MQKLLKNVKKRLSVFLILMLVLCANLTAQSATQLPTEKKDSEDAVSELTIEEVMEIAEEDVNAFLTMYGTTLYTNIGKNQIRFFDIKTRKQVQMSRSASLPLKLARSGNRIAVLNRDGSISWYNAGNGKVIADWYMTTEKQWYEF